MALLPNVDRYPPSYAPARRQSVQHGEPPDVAVEDTAYVGRNGAVRRPFEVRWTKRGSGLFTTVWAGAPGTLEAERPSVTALYPVVAWRNITGSVGTTPLAEWRKLMAAQAQKRGGDNG